jgi:hypothetical protein
LRERELLRSITERLGATNFRWDADVRRVVQQTLSEFPQLTANTYRRHPRLLYRLHPSVRWSRRSVDLWGAGGRGHALDLDTADSSAAFLLSLPGRPLIRHLIYGHNLWTSWGGWSVWDKEDHAGELRHCHVTYWPG